MPWWSGSGPKAEAKESPPPSDGNAHYRQPSAPFEFKSLGDNCFDDAKSPAEYALSLVQAKASRAGGHWKDPTEVKEKNREFDVCNGAAERDLAANPAAHDELRADVKKWLKKFSTGRSRYYQRYDWKRGDASGSVLAFGGKAVDPGKTLTVMVLITGTQDCAKVGNEASKFKVFYAVLVGKFDLSDSGHDHHKSGGETKLAKIRQICCGLTERTPTGTTPKETPTPKAPETGTPKTVEKPPPVDKSKTFKSITPGAALPNPDESSYLPSTAGPGSAIVATYVDPQQSGPSDAIVTLITDNGQEHNYKTKTDGNHKLKFTLPVKVAGALGDGVAVAQGLQRRSNARRSRGALYDRR